MSKKRNPEKSASMNESFNPKRECPDNTETRQIGESSHSIDNVYLPNSFDALNFQNPNFDIALGQLALQIKESQPSTPKSTDDQIEALQITSDRMAELERAAELVLAAESDADFESSGDANAVSGSAEDSADQMVASESPVESSTTWDSAELGSPELESPEPSRMNLLYNLVRQYCPAFTDSKRMRDEYGITTIRDEILLESHHKLLFLLHEYRRHNGDAGLETFLCRALMMEVKYLYSLSLIRNVVLEGDGSDSSPLYPPPGEEGRLFCAALSLGFTFLALAECIRTGRIRKFKQIDAICLRDGISFLNESHIKPLHPLIEWLLCIKESYTEIKHYSIFLKNSLVRFFTKYEESINRELDRLATI